LPLSVMPSIVRAIGSHSESSIINFFKSGHCPFQNRPLVTPASTQILIYLNKAGHGREQTQPHNAETAQKAFAQPGLAEVTAMRNGNVTLEYPIL
jgi:hypothetical protein